MKKIVQAIYMLTINNKKYIGSTKDLRRRITQHKSDLKNNRHCNKHLQNLYNKYGMFKLTILEKDLILTPQELLEKEKQYMLIYKPEINMEKDPVTHDRLANVKKVYQFNLKGEFINEYNSVTEAIHKTGFTNIKSVVLNTYGEKTAGGYLWSFEKKSPCYNDDRSLPIHCYSIEGNYLCTYKNYRELLQEISQNYNSYETERAAIYRVCIGKKGSFMGLRFSFEKKDRLDNSLLLKINKKYPIVQYNDLGYYKVWDEINSAVKALGISSQKIVEAISKNRKINNYKWKRLGT